MNKSEETIKLAEEILKNIELEEICWSSIVMKCSRLARLTDNLTVMRAFQCELSGYPNDESGNILPEAWLMGEALNRVFTGKDKEGRR